MLAGPRVKQKFSINPRGANWSNDDSKFGQKIMEKFGWAKGKGLGAKEDGKTEHVKVSVKGDNRGVGCSKSHADNWIAHQDDFNQLLSNLNQNTETNDEEKSAEEKNKVQSLEVKSKTSRSRVHYMKFTKGKDLSSRSEQDLDCIFGKRKSKSESNTPLTQSADNSGDEDTDDQSHGINIVKSTDSVQEYFARKMAELKKKKESGQTLKNSVTTGENLECDNKFQNEEESDSDNKNEKTVTFTLGGDSSSENEGNTKRQKSKKKKKKDKKNLNKNEKVTIEENEEVNTKKNKKKRMNEDISDCPSPKMSKSSAEEELMEESTKSKKKKKKAKRSKNEDLNNDIDNKQNSELEQKVEMVKTEKLKKKAKKSKKEKKERK